MKNSCLLLASLKFIFILASLCTDFAEAQKPLLVRTEPFANAVYLDVLPFHRLSASPGETLNNIKTGPLWIQIDHRLSIEIELDTLNSWSRRILDWGESRTQGFSDAIRKQIAQTLLRQFGLNADKWHKKREVAADSKPAEAEGHSDQNDETLPGTRAGHVLSDHELLKLGFVRARLIHNPTAVPVMQVANLTLADQINLLSQCNVVSVTSSAVLVIHQQSKQLRELRLTEKHSYGSDTSKDRAARRATVTWLSMFDPMPSQQFKGYYNAWTAVNSISAWSETSMCIVDLTSDQVFERSTQTPASQRTYDMIPEDVEVSVFYRLDKDASYWKDKQADSYAVRRGLPYLLPVISNEGLAYFQNTVTGSSTADVKLATLPAHGLVLEFEGGSTMKDTHQQQQQQRYQFDYISKSVRAWREKEDETRGITLSSLAVTALSRPKKAWQICMDDYRPKETLIKQDTVSSVNSNGSSYVQITSFGTNLLNRDATWLSYYRGNNKVRLYITNHSSIYNISGATAFLICLAVGLCVGAFFASHFTQGHHHHHNHKCYTNTAAAAILVEVPTKSARNSTSEISYDEQIRLSSKAAFFSFGLWLVCIVTMVTLASDVTIYINNGATEPSAVVNYVLGSTWLVLQLVALVWQTWARTLKTNLALASIQLFANGSTLIFVVGNLLLYDVSRPFNLALFAVVAFGVVLYLWDVFLDTLMSTINYQLRYRTDPVISVCIMSAQLASIVIYAVFFYDYSIRPAALTFSAMFYTSTSIQYAIWCIWLGLSGIMIMRRLYRV